MFEPCESDYQVDIAESVVDHRWNCGRQMGTYLPDGRPVLLVIEDVLYDVELVLTAADRFGSRTLAPDAAGETVPALPEPERCVLLGDAKPVPTFMIADAYQNVQVMVIERGNDHFHVLLLQAGDELVEDRLAKIRRQVNGRAGRELGETG